MKSDLKNRPLETNCFHGQRRLAAPHFTLAVSRQFKHINWVFMVCRGRLAPTRMKFWATHPPQTINTQLICLNYIE